MDWFDALRPFMVRRFRLGWVWFHAVRFGMAVWVCCGGMRCVLVR